ncbi:MAG: hypothetical protein U0R51_05345 [Solirubrobacterales bacterium]
MRKAGIVGALVALVALFAAVGIAEAKVKNGNFEKGDFSGWKTKTSDKSNKWVVYTNKTRDDVTNPPMTRGGAPAYRLPKTKGKYSSVIDMDGEGHNVLYRTLKVPKKAKTLKLQAFWGNLAEAWVFSGSFKAQSSGDQYWSIDLLDPKADPESTKNKDVLANVFKPDPEKGGPIMTRSYRSVPRRGGSGSTTPYTSDWKKFAVNVNAFRGEKVQLRLAEVDTLLFDYVGIDNVKFAK